MTIDIQMTAGKRVLYYLHWIKDFGFIKMRKNEYEKRFSNQEIEEK